MGTSDRRILLTGATGFLGRHARAVLETRYGPASVRAVGSRDYDLLDARAVARMFEDVRPTSVVHLAGVVGGIALNAGSPADLLYKNALVTLHVFDAAARSSVERLVYTASGCCYPGDATTPIGETQLWEGYPQRENAPYSSAKRLGIVASTAYRAQWGLDSVALIPGNLYGEYDNFRERDSHVVAALVRRFHAAKLAKKDEIVLWGSGRPKRDFTYAGDVAALLPWFLEQHVSDPVNVSTGTGTTIRELAETIARLTGFEGRLVWDSSKPDGQLEKTFSTERLAALGLACPTALEDGLRRTVEWFAKNYEGALDGLRL
jgi:GDP-L-fucose synthase